jgi:hypothetical protein
MAEIAGPGEQHNELRLGNLEWTNPASPERIARRQRHRIFRGARRIIGAALAFAILGAIVFGALLLVTPSVANAPGLIRNLERAHDSASAGQVAARFTTALKAIQDRGSGPRNGSMSGAIALVGQLLGSTESKDQTVDQRLASILYLRGRGGGVAQVEQAFLVLKLHWKYSETQLTRMFAAVAGFGHGYTGVVAASCGYFGQPPGHLSWAQIALLAAAAMNPAADDPYEHPARAKHDQAAVLRALAASGRLGPIQATRFAAEPLHLRGQLASSRPRGARKHHAASSALRSSQACASASHVG